MDLEKSFDRVNHEVLMARLARRVKDKRVLKLVRRYLQAGLLTGGVVSPRTEGIPQGGPLSPLLSNVLLDGLDRELERRGHRFVRYADDCNVYVKSRAAGERVLTSLEQFLAKRLRLKVNRTKSAVDRPWKRKFLGYTVTLHYRPKLRVAPQSVARLKDKFRPLLRAGRGRRLADVCAKLAPIVRGWAAYCRLAEVKAPFEELDQWLRRKLRCLLWRQWKRWHTRITELRRRGIEITWAVYSALNGRGPWWNAGSLARPCRIAGCASGDCSVCSMNNDVPQQTHEPPYMDPYVRWLGRREVERLPPTPSRMKIVSQTRSYSRTVPKIYARKFIAFRPTLR